jgi:hypothetical protein
VYACPPVQLRPQYSSSSACQQPAGPAVQQSSLNKPSPVQSSKHMTEAWNDYSSHCRTVRRPVCSLDSQAPADKTTEAFLRPPRKSPAQTPGQRRPTLTSQGAAVLNPQRPPSMLHAPHPSLRTVQTLPRASPSCAAAETLFSAWCAIGVPCHSRRQQNRGCSGLLRLAAPLEEAKRPSDTMLQGQARQDRSSSLGSVWVTQDVPSLCSLPGSAQHNKAHTQPPWLEQQALCSLRRHVATGAHTQARRRGASACAGGLLC